MSLFGAAKLGGQKTCSVNNQAMSKNMIWLMTMINLHRGQRLIAQVQRGKLPYTTLYRKLVWTLSDF